MMDAETSKAIIATAIALPSTAAITVAGWLLNRLLTRRAAATNGDAEVEVYSVKEMLGQHMEDDRTAFTRVHEDMKAGFTGIHSRLDGMKT